jgi:protoporphyrinogen oxidase
MESPKSKKIAVIGAGPMGLACAYHLLKQGYAVDVYEKDDRIGGMSACFNFDGLTIERYYHFICRSDSSLFDLLTELNIDDQLRWRNTKMGFFYQGVLYKWGNPIHLLTFPKLSWIAKLRYALHIIYTKNVNNWDKLDQQNAIAWLKKWVGETAYQQLWDYLLELKFYQQKYHLSAAWIATRIKRIALSRNNLFTENLGYLEGGSNTLLSALEKQILALHGQIFLQTQIDQLVVNHNQIQGLMIAGETRSYDGVIATIPLPYLPRLIPELPSDIIDKINAIKNFGVVCVVLKLRYPLTENFWLNINDANMKIPGIIEYTNLCPLPVNIVYIPYYMPTTSPKYTQDKHQFFQEVFSYLKRINPNFSESWVLAAHLSRYEFAQPVCTPNFYSQLPPMQTSITGFFMADTSYSYPEDRSITESVKLGKELAKLISNALA